MEFFCRKEIERLHEFFVAWFNATIDEGEFGERCSKVLAEDMIMIDPSGRISTHSQLVERLLGAYGCHKGKQFSIDIRNVQFIRMIGEDCCLMTYKECQLLDAVLKQRRSSVIFRSQDNTPHGVQWLHLHETWIDSNERTSWSPKKEANVEHLNEPGKMTLISKRRHISPQISQLNFAVVERDTDVVGIELHGWKITTQQGPIGDDAWFGQATERLQELAQPPPSKDGVENTIIAYRHLCLPEMVFPRAHVTLERAGLKLKWGAYVALLEWAKAHNKIPLGSSEQVRGVSVLQSKDAKLWSSKAVAVVHVDGTRTDFHYDWTFSTPHACTTTMDMSWTPLPKSGMNVALLQDQSVPILLFDEVVLYEDDLHDNGQTTLTCKIRVMPTCVYCLERLWVRVDGVMLRVRETRVSLEFGKDNCDKIFRDVVWRQCPWGELGKHDLPRDLRSWCPETPGGVSDTTWQALIQKLPEVALPDDLPAHSVLDITCL